MFDQKKYDAEYKKKNYKQLSIRLKIDQFDRIERGILKLGYQKKDFILKAIEEKLEKECGKGMEEHRL